MVSIPLAQKLVKNHNKMDIQFHVKWPIIMKNNMTYLN